ncbi:hypothetical protein JX265_006097 [Neoarthrinium moseri]|uniref:Nucleoside phosphorylase domain-containing protein n=1 Tax=Neoarthrinium moseri TaxID=1658444 RepID=A0A9P9WN01_9PEZI|nr:hypothetical protein JX265_006097 [Neoarthrinium moseri]
MGHTPKATDFTVGWVCALPIELAAAAEIMDEEYDNLDPQPPPPPTDTNVYTYGRIGVHQVVAACLPAGQMGNNQAAVVASQMRNSFPALRFGLLVGVGGGVPSGEYDIRLGDVVISQPTGQHGGVIQFDFGKTGLNGRISRTGSLNAPPPILLNALAKLRANDIRGKTTITQHLSKVSSNRKFACPGPQNDTLYAPASRHIPGPTCCMCCRGDVIKRLPRATPEPVLFFGNIASGNQVMKDGPTRDCISHSLGGVMCFEMEAAGLMNNFPCLVLRGICDYADEHKNKKWQAYAAATAAAYAKELLSIVSPSIEMSKAPQVKAPETSRAVPQANPSRPASRGRRIQHYIVPISSSSIYTGRESELETVRQAFESTTANLQKRFVIYGGPGTGKTALALRYAQDSAVGYWGVFWIDASNLANAEQSYAEIGKQVGTDGKINSVKYWFSARPHSESWLLIIDNADYSGHDGVRLDDLFPPGINGSVLVTTRDPYQRSHGTVGSRHLELGNMISDDAINLFLQATEEKPSQTSRQRAMEICERLHFLPLAILYAGRAIHKNPSLAKGYERYFDSKIQRLRDDWYRHRRNSPGVATKDYLALQFEDDTSRIFATFEMLVDLLETRATEGNRQYQDALQMIHVFSYMHFQDIRLEMLIDAAVNLELEATQEQEEKRKEEHALQQLNINTKQTRQSNAYNLVRAMLWGQKSPAVLPEVLKSPDHHTGEMLKHVVSENLKNSLQVLVSMSLLIRHGRDGHESYRIHPLVHQWIRHRPQRSIAEQALFCQLAKTTLARASRLIGGDSKDELAKRGPLKPHIDHARRCWTQVQSDIENQRQQSRWTWLPGRFKLMRATFGPLQASETARFGKIYLDCSAFEVAEGLFREVLDYLLRVMGPDHNFTHRVKLALAVAVFYQSRRNEQSELLSQIYESQKRSLGHQHPRTLDTMTLLAECILHQTRITEGLALCEAALQGLLRAYGHDHKATLRCLYLIGKAYHWKMENEKSEKYHQDAYKGAQRLRGTVDAVPEDDFLMFKQEYALATIRLGSTYHEAAERLQREVLAERIRLSGVENLVTLQARAVLSRIWARQRRYAKAYNDMEENLNIALRQLPVDNMLILAGKTWFADALVQRGTVDDLARAQTLLTPALEKAKYANAAGPDGEHVDHITAMWVSINCLAKQHRFEEAMHKCLELRAGIHGVGNHGFGAKHIFNNDLNKMMAQLAQRIQANESGTKLEPFEYIDIYF